MPSPLGHALGGILVGLSMMPRTRGTFRTFGTFGTPGTLGTLGTLGTPGTLRTLGTLAVVACLPDIDFLWGRHAMETHSVFVAAAVGLAVLLAIKGRNKRLALACALAWASHVLFDWLGSDDSPPLGVMALWPLTSNFYLANAFVFEAISRRYAEPGFWEQNIWAVVKEALMLVPPTVALWWWRNRETRRT